YISGLSTRRATVPRGAVRVVTGPVHHPMEGKPARRCTNLVGIRLPWYVIYPEWLGRGRSLGAAGRPAGAGGRAPRGHPGLWPWEATDVENRGEQRGAR